MTSFPSGDVATGATVAYPTQATAGNTCNIAVSNPQSVYSTQYELNIYKDSLAYAGYALDIGKATIENKVYYYYGHGFGGSASIGGRFDPSQYTGEVLPAHSYNNTNRIGDVLNATIPLVNAVTLKAGLLFQHSNEEHDELFFTPGLQPISVDGGDFDYNEPVITQTFEPYVNLTLQPIPQLIIDVGARYLTIQRDLYESSVRDGVFDQAHTAAGPGSTCSASACYDKLLPSLGVNYEFTPGYHAYANITQNARPPSYNTFFAGLGATQDLQLEKATTEEVGLLARSGNLEGRLSGFYTTYKNYILSLEEQAANSSTTGSRVINAGDAHYYGLSLALTYQFKEWLSGFLNAGVLHTDLGPTTLNVSPLQVFDLPSTEVDNAPHSTLAAGFEVHEGSFFGSIAAHYKGKRIDWGLDSFASGGTIFNIYNNKQLPSITTLDASLAYNWVNPFAWKGVKGLETRLTFTNIANVQKPTSYGANSFTDYEFGNPIIYLNEPFSVYATITANF
jgi:iron complex outermembrane receptor protein